MIARNTTFALAAIFIGFGATAAPISQEDALNAAKSFITSDPVGFAILGGRTVADAQKRGELWVVALAPAGHLVFNASDRAKPIVEFAPTDFEAPFPGSAAYDLLESASERVRALESDPAAERHGGWDALLAPSPAKRLLGAGPVADPGTVIVPPLLNSSYDQTQPYNDFMPVCDPDDDTEYYRGRTPCGCVATSAVSAMRYFQWPARIDREIVCDHLLYNGASTAQTFPIRFDGHNPIDWTALDTSYIYYYRTAVTNWVTETYWSSWYWQYNFDLRGTVAESVRFPIARAILFAGVLSQMTFGSGSSLASYETAATGLSDWYTLGNRVDLETFSATVINHLQNGIPCQLSLNSGSTGHAVIIHGWAQNSTAQYAYIDCGWSGSGDGYYDISDSFTLNGTDYTQKQVFINHFPRAKPQLDPVPVVSGSDLSLSWHFPNLYTNKLSGFIVSAERLTSATTSFTDDFSNSSGVSEPFWPQYTALNQLYIGTDSTLGSGRGEMLIAEPLATSTFTFQGKFPLTAASAVSFKLRSINANFCTYEIQASFDDNEWVTILAPELAFVQNGRAADSGWQTHSVNLAAYSGRTARFRIRKGVSQGSYYSSPSILLDDFTVSGVAKKETKTATTSATARQYTWPQLVQGGNYTFTVTPVLYSTFTLVGAESSAPVSTTVNGSTTPDMPEILHVAETDEGFYRECGTNVTVFTVQCTPNVTCLTARPSHLALVGDADITYANEGNGLFKVAIAPHGVNETNWRSRMILTLAAKDADGNTAYKDLSIRFDKIEEPSGERTVEVCVDPTSPASASVSVPCSWLDDYGLVSGTGGLIPGDADYAFVATLDSDGDGQANWQEFVCGTDPTNTESKLECKLELLQGGGVSLSISGFDNPAPGYSAAIKGSTDLRVWNPYDPAAGQTFFKVVVEQD